MHILTVITLAVAITHLEGSESGPSVCIKYNHDDANSSADDPQIIIHEHFQQLKLLNLERARYDQKLVEERVASAQLLKAQQFWHEQEMSKQRRQMESAERDLRRQMELRDERKIIAVCLGLLLLTIGIIIGAHL